MYKCVQDVPAKCFALYSSDSDEAKRGWDRLPVPQGFIDLMENYVLKRWSGRMTPPKSPTARKRAWLNILGGHFGTEREKYFAHLAVPFTNAYDMVVDRYERRLTFHQQNHVSICAQV